MTYDRTASGQSFADFQKKAEADFWEAVATKVNSRQRYTKVRVHPGVSLPFLVIEGTDSSDIPVDGHAALILGDNHEVRVSVDMKGAYPARRDVKFKTGELTTDLAAAIVLEVLGVRG